LVELGLLIGNKVEERFALKIDHIRLKWLFRFSIKNNIKSFVFIKLK
jgi:hypothetical protein